MATVGTFNLTRAANVTDLYPNAASAAGDKFTPGDDRILFFANSSGAPITVTVTTPGTAGGLAIADLTIEVPATGNAARANFPASLFGGSDGLVSMTYSTHTGLTFGVGRVI